MGRGKPTLTTQFGRKSSTSAPSKCWDGLVRLLLGVPLCAPPNSGTPPPRDTQRCPYLRPAGNNSGRYQPRLPGCLGELRTRALANQIVRWGGAGLRGGKRLKRRRAGLYGVNARLQSVGTGTARGAGGDRAPLLGV